MDSNLNNLVIIGLLAGMIKFSIKASLGCGFATLRKREILAIALIYFFTALVIGTSIGIMGEALDRYLNVLLDFAPFLGLFQSMIALFLIVLGLHTIKKWVSSEEDLTRKTFLMLSVPCPGSIVTIFISCLFLIMEGIEGVKVGLLVGSVFLLSILGISLTIKKFKLKKSPSSLGGIMVFFGLFYLFSILIIPAYLPVSKMDITIDFQISDMIPGFLFMTTMISMGFILERIKS